jgi:hypothetical protein
MQKVGGGGIAGSAAPIRSRIASGRGQHPDGLARRATGDHLVDGTETAPRRPVTGLAPFVATASTYGSRPRSGLPASRQAV